MTIQWLAVLPTIRNSYVDQRNGGLVLDAKFKLLKKPA